MRRVATQLNVIANACTCIDAMIKGKQYLKVYFLASIGVRRALFMGDTP